MKFFVLLFIFLYLTACGGNDSAPGVGAPGKGGPGGKGGRPAREIAVEGYIAEAHESDMPASTSIFISSQPT